MNPLGFKLYPSLKLFAAILMVVLFSWLNYHLHRDHVSDLEPDIYYHLAISRQYVDHLVPSTIEQVRGLNWEISFVDKEFLFHVVTGIMLALFGEGVLLQIAAFFGVLINVSIFLVGYSLSRSWLALALVLAALAANGHFLYRISMFRPQLLAILLFVWLIWALLNFRPWLVGVLCALSCLSYHAFYIPLSVVVLGVLLLDAPVSEKKRMAILGLGGLLVGIFSNPYFPGNVLVSIQHIMVALGTMPIDTKQFGVELQPVTAKVWLFRYGFLLSVVMVSFYQLGMRRAKNIASMQSKKLFLVGATFTFLILSFIQTRTVEYLVPTAIFLLIAIMISRNSLRLIASLMIPFFVLALITTVKGIRQMKSHSTPEQLARVSRDLRIIEPQSELKNLFHCSVFDGATILYERPDLAVVDLLDPTFLYIANRKLYEARKLLLDGQLIDPFLVLKTLYDTHFVYCRDETAGRVLIRDPHFVPLSPHVYRVDPSARDKFVNSWLVTSTDNLSSPVPVNGMAEDGKMAKVWLELPQKLLGTKDCIIATPSPAEMERLEGASHLGIGAGQKVEIFLNGDLLAAVPRPSDPALLQMTHALERPVAREDVIQVKWCSPGYTSGLALSLWTTPPG